MRMSTTPRAPHPSVAVAGLLGVLMAAAPSTLPRGVDVTVVLTAATVATTTTIATIATRRRRPATTGGPARRAVPAAAGIVAVAAIIASWWWQTRLHAALGPDVGAAPNPWVWIIATSATATAVFAAIVWAPRATAVTAALVTAFVFGTLAPASAAPDTAVTPGMSTSWGAKPSVPQEVLYGRLSDAPVAERALALVERWRSTHHGPPGSVVVAVPTGSGWIDAAAVTGLRTRLGADVPILGLQYDDASSWRSFVSHRDAAGTAAIAVLRALTGLPESQRPTVHLYGQSLGAIGADAGRAWAAEHAPGLVLGTMLVGVPAGTVDIARPDPGSPRVIIANLTDPVVRWSPMLAVRPPRSPEGTIDTGRAAPRPPWLPVISFLQTSVDLLAALDAPSGVGHRYGTEQGQLMPSAATTTAPDPADQAIGPRAASYAAPTR